MKYTQEYWAKRRLEIYGSEPEKQITRPQTEYSDPNADNTWLEDTLWGMGRSAAQLGDIGTELIAFASKKIGLENFGQFVKDLGDSAVDYWESKMSTQMVERISADFLPSKNEQGEWELGPLMTDIPAILSMVASSIPTSFGGMAMGAIATRTIVGSGLIKSVTAASKTYKSLSPLAKGLTRKEVKAVAEGLVKSKTLGRAQAQSFRQAQKTLAVTNAITHGFLGEGIVAGGIGGLEARDRFLETPHDELYRNSTQYREMYDSVDIGEAEVPGEREKFVKEMLAQKYALNVGLKTWLSTGIMSSPAGYVFSDLIQGGVGAFAKSRLGAIGRGAKYEALQEFFQSGSETLLTNIESRKSIDDKLDIWAGVFEDAAKGALAGSILGGAFGLGAQTQKGETLQAMKGRGRNLAEEASNAVAQLREKIKSGEVDKDGASEFLDQLAQKILPDKAGEVRITNMVQVIEAYEEFEKTGEIPKVAEEVKPEVAEVKEPAITEPTVDKKPTVEKPTIEKLTVAKPVTPKKTVVKPTKEVQPISKVVAPVEPIAPTIKPDVQADLRVDWKSGELVVVEGKEETLTPFRAGQLNRKASLKQQALDKPQIWETGQSALNAKGKTIKITAAEADMMNALNTIQEPVEPIEDYSTFWSEERQVKTDWKSGDLVISESGKQETLTSIKAGQLNREASLKSIAGQTDIIEGQEWIQGQSVSLEKGMPIKLTAVEATMMNRLTPKTIKPIEPFIPENLRKHEMIVLDKKLSKSNLNPTYVVDILKDGKFEKSILVKGARSKEEAEKSVDGEVGAVTTMTTGKLREWAEKGDLTKPLSSTFRKGGEQYVPIDKVQVKSAKLGNLNFQITEASGTAVLKGSKNDTSQSIDAVVLSVEKGRTIYVYDRLRNNRLKDHFVVYGAENEKQAHQAALDHIGLDGIGAFKAYNAMQFGKWISQTSKADRVSLDNWVDTSDLTKVKVKMLSLKEVERSVERLTQKFTSIDVITLANYSELPQHVRERFNEAGYQERLAATWDPVSGSAYIIGDMIRDVQTLEEYIIEETVGHAGLKTFFKAQNGQAELNKLFDQTYQSFKDDSDFKNIVELYTLNMRSSIDRRHAAEEFIAKIDPSDSTYATLYDKFRAVLNRLLGKMGFKTRLNRADLHLIMKRLDANVRSQLAPPYGREFKPHPVTSTHTPTIVKSKEGDKLDTSLYPERPLPMAALQQPSPEWMDDNVILEDGKAKVFYHGTVMGGFEKFNTKIAYFASSPIEANFFVEGFSDEGYIAPNIIPVYIKATLFDYRNKKHTDMLKSTLRANPAFRSIMVYKVMAGVYFGSWESMEEDIIQTGIKELGFGGFYVKEDLFQKEPNVGIYTNQPDSIRSAIADVPMAALVYHGSPHKWSVLDMMQAGTGQGTDAKGFGFYTAQVRSVAMIYTSNRRAEKISEELKQELIEARQSLRDGDPNDDMIRMMGSEGSQEAAEGRIARMLGETTYLYDLELSDSAIEAMLDFDIPLSQQNPTVKAALRELYRDDDILDTLSYGADEQGWNVPEVDDPDFSGADLYNLLRFGFGESYDASMVLLDAGIRGNKYLDGFSRKKGQGSVNYVVFDQSDITVLARNGEPIGAPQPDRPYLMTAYPDGTTEYRTQRDYESLLINGDPLHGAIHATATEGGQINWAEQDGRLMILNAPEQPSAKLFDKMIINAASMGYSEITLQRDLPGLTNRAALHGYRVRNNTIEITESQAREILYGEPMAALVHNRTSLGDVEELADKYLSRDFHDMNFVEKTKATLNGLKFWENTDWLWKVKFNIADSGVYVEKMETELFGGLLDASESGYKALTLTRNLPSVIGHIFKYGLPKYVKGGWQFNEKTKGFAKIWEPLYSHDYEGRDLMRAFATLAVAKRAIVLHEEGKGRENNMPLEDARRLVAEIEEDFVDESGNSIVNSVWQNYQKFNNELLDLLMLHGVLDEAGYKAFRDNAYVPFYRAMEEIHGGANSGMTRRGVASQSFMNQKLTGSEAMVDGAVFENIVMNMSSLIDGLYKTMAMRKIADIGVTAGVMRQMRNYPLLSETLRPDYIMRAMQLQGLVPGIDVEAESIDPAIQELYDQMVSDETIESFVSNLSIQPVTHGNVVTLRRDGKTEYYSVMDSNLLDSIKDMQVEEMGWILKLLRGPKNFLTKMVTLAPGFMLVSNPIRDTVAAWIQTGFKMRPFIDAWRGAVVFAKDEVLPRNMMVSGAGGGGWYDTTAGDLRKMLRNESAKLTKHGALRKLGRAYIRVGAIAENANRMAVAKAVLDSGGTMAEAMYQAQDVLNFSMHGSAKAMRFLIQTVPFMNARVQGLYRLRRGMRDNPNTFYVRGAMVAAFSMALAAFNADNDEYDALKDWAKDAYWHYMDPFGLGFNVTIPKPFEAGVIFGMIPERMVRLATGQDDFKKLWERMGRAFLDTFAFNPFPQAFKPMYEVYTDRSMFTGNEIIGQWLGRLPPEQQITPWTSETARMLAKIMPEIFGEKLRSPVVLQHLVRAYSGTMGSYILQMADVMTRKVGDFPKRAKREAVDIPVISRLTSGRKGEMRSNRYQQQLREILNTADQTYAGLRKLADTEDWDGFLKLFKNNRELMMYRSGLNKYNKLIQRINRATRQIASDKAMSGERKRELMRELTKIKNQYLLAAAPLLEKLD